jgi:hypothetical protein
MANKSNEMARDVGGGYVESVAAFDITKVRRCNQCGMPIQVMSCGQIVRAARGGCMTCAIRVLNSEPTTFRVPNAEQVKPALLKLDAIPEDQQGRLPQPVQPRPVIARVCDDCGGPVEKRCTYCKPCATKRRKFVDQRANENYQRSHKKKSLDAGVAALAGPGGAER